MKTLSRMMCLHPSTSTSMEQDKYDLFHVKSFLCNATFNLISVLVPFLSSLNGCIDNTSPVDAQDSVMHVGVHVCDIRGVIQKILYQGFNCDSEAGPGGHYMRL